MRNGTRNAARKLPFICLAGTQVEEIELAFADGLPLPQKIDGRRVDTKSFAYSTEYRLENRTLKVRREFVSRVPGQVCAADLEAEIAQPMRDVIAEETAPGAQVQSDEAILESIRSTGQLTDENQATLRTILEDFTKGFEVHDHALVAGEA